ncbi:MAG: isoprenyl transferase [Gammaproteobacteria bacterium]|nr:MAG: isoprenyl transferase [Gammaproteobacteria bacterium]
MAAPPGQSSAQTVPEHVAVIMDGNGRWARSRGMPRAAGHRAGVKSAKAIVQACGERGIRVLTLFAFSSENWSRPRSEVSALMKLMLEALGREVNELAQKGVQLRFVGARHRLSEDIQNRMANAEQCTSGNDKLILVIALGYGGRWDLVQAAQELAREVRDGGLEPEAIDEESISRHLSLAPLPDPDLLIRTGGESRISNFLLWNLAYSELYFTDCLWPDFDSSGLDEALAFFASRDRRFGRVVEKVGSA